jgi:hypothetical protein
MGRFGPGTVRVLGPGGVHTVSLVMLPFRRGGLRQRPLPVGWIGRLAYHLLSKREPDIVPAFSELLRRFDRVLA